MGKRAIADILGVAHSTVSSDRKAPEEERTEPTLEHSEIESDHNGRLAALSEDLAKRVEQDGMSLDEAEHVATERQKRIAAYVKKVREALDILAGMIGHPVPSELKTALSKDERQLQSMVEREQRSQA